MNTGSVGENCDTEARRKAERIKRTQSRKLYTEKEKIETERERERVINGHTETEMTGRMHYVLVRPILTCSPSLFSARKKQNKTNEHMREQKKTINR